MYYIYYTCPDSELNCFKQLTFFGQYNSLTEVQGIFHFLKNTGISINSSKQDIVIYVLDKPMSFFEDEEDMAKINSYKNILTFTFSEYKVSIENMSEGLEPTIRIVGVPEGKLIEVEDKAYEILDSIFSNEDILVPISTYTDIGLI